MPEEKFQQDIPEEEDFGNLEEFTSDINQNLDRIRSTTDQFFKRKLIAFCIRWTLTLGLLYFFMDSYPWLKYLVYAVIPLGILNLGLIFYGRHKINEKVTDTENKINSL